MTRRDIIVIGGSAGALEPLLKLVDDLSPHSAASLFVVIHTAADSPGMLPHILQRATTLEVGHALDGEPIRSGRVYIAPPDQHLVLNRGTVAVQRGPRENGFRPAIDPLFRSAAACYRERVVGVILSGGLDDGTFGLRAIKEHGGLAVVQHPDDAMVPQMPLSAIQNAAVDLILKRDEMGAKLTELVSNRHPPRKTISTEAEDRAMSSDRDISLGGTPPDQIACPPSIYTCPECGGTLWEFDQGSTIPRFRCHTGHGFTAESLLAESNGRLEQALWTAVRVLEERAALHRRLMNQTEQRGLTSAAERYRAQADDAEAKSLTIRSLLEERVSRAAEELT